MKLASVLKGHRNFSSVLPENLQFSHNIIFDLENPKSLFYQIDFSDTQALITLTKDIMQQQNAVLGIGRYAERRILYQRCDFNRNIKLRDFHLGIDLTVPVTTSIATPLPAIVHSFQDNKNFGDYGPTIILQHELSNKLFYTLYGHLSRYSLKNLAVGMKLEQGEKFATVGNNNENGSWVPHLHFQIIDNIGDYSGDYPGACNYQEKEYYLDNCPDPNLILKIPNLS